MLNRYTLGPYCYLNDYSRQIILIHFQRVRKKKKKFYILI